MIFRHILLQVRIWDGNSADWEGAPVGLEVCGCGREWARIGLNFAVQAGSGQNFQPVQDSTT